MSISFRSGPGLGVGLGVYMDWVGVLLWWVRFGWLFGLYNIKGPFGFIEIHKDHNCNLAKLED